jgi:hypothetical protein
MDIVYIDKRRYGVEEQKVVPVYRHIAAHF